MNSSEYEQGWSDNYHYVHFVDVIQVDLSSGSSVSKSYPGYEYCDLTVVPLGVRYWIFGLSINTSLGANGVPYVNISWGGNNSSPTSFYVLATRMDLRASHVSKIAGVYGIELQDKSGDGQAWIPDAYPMYFLERYEGTHIWQKVAGRNDIAGWCEVETWTNKPPLCMWKSKSHERGSLSNYQYRIGPPSMNALPSRNAPTKRNYRWVVGCEQGQGFSGATGTNWNSFTYGPDYILYVFEAYKPPRVTDYGIELIGDYRSLVLGDGVPLAVSDLWKPANWSGTGSSRDYIRSPDYASRYTTVHWDCFSHMPWLIDSALYQGKRHITTPRLGGYNISYFHRIGSPDGGDALKNANWFYDYMRQSDLTVLVASTYYLDKIMSVD